MCSTVCAVEDDISQCASAAVNGYTAWGGLTCYQRAKVLLRYSKLNFSTDCFYSCPDVDVNVRVTCPPLTGW